MLQNYNDMTGFTTILNILIISPVMTCNYVFFNLYEVGNYCDTCQLQYFIAYGECNDCSNLPRSG